MKKLILSAALVLGSLTAFAQDQATTSKSSTTTKSTTTTQPATTTQEPATSTQTPADATKQAAYTEITVAEVPENIKASLTKAYPTAKLDKAFINEAKEYKLEVAIGEKRGNLFADANGKWIQK